MSAVNPKSVNPNSVNPNSVNHNMRQYTFDEVEAIYTLANQGADNSSIASIGEIINVMNEAKVMRHTYYLQYLLDKRQINIEELKISLFNKFTAGIDTTLETYIGETNERIKQLQDKIVSDFNESNSKFMQKMEHAKRLTMSIVNNSLTTSN